MKNIDRIVIIYPGETSSERINNPANYSFSRLLIRLHETDDVPIHFLNQSRRYEKYGNIEFQHFTPATFLKVWSRSLGKGNTLIITQTHAYLRYALLLRSMLPGSKLLVRLGGVYYGRGYLSSASFTRVAQTELKGLRRADMILSTADGTPVDYYMQRVGVGPERYRKWLNGFPSIHNPDGYRRADQIVCIARLSPEKGVDYVIRSYALARPHLHRHHNLVIVGGGDYTDELKKLTRDLGIADYVRFEGDSFDIAKHLYSSKLLVSGLANNPIMEAIATDTPVVAVELGETADLYGEYPNVHIVGYPPGGCGRIPAQYMDDLCKDTAAVIVEVLNNYSRVEANSASNGRKLFGWDQRLAQELELYEAMFTDPETVESRSGASTSA